MSHGALPCLSKCWNKPSSGSIKLWDILVKNICVKHFSNVIIITGSDTQLTGSSVSIANNISCLAKAMAY